MESNSYTNTAVIQITVSDKRSINAKTKVKKSSEDPGAPGSLLIRASPGLPGAQRVVEYWNLENISWSLLFLNCVLIYHILLIDISCSVKWLECPLHCLLCIYRFILYIKLVNNFFYNCFSSIHIYVISSVTT